MKNPSEGAGQGPHITTPHSPASHVNSPCKCALLLHFCCFSHHRSRAACTKVTKCTECQQALSFGESDDFTLRCSQYGTRAHCAMPPPHSRSPLWLLRWLCECVCAAYLRSGSPHHGCPSPALPHGLQWLHTTSLACAVFCLWRGLCSRLLYHSCFCCPSGDALLCQCVRERHKQI